ncbi:unnamed protein product, partial [Laminaria digitata]
MTADNADSHLKEDFCGPRPWRGKERGPDNGARDTPHADPIRGAQEGAGE